MRMGFLVAYGVSDGGERAGELKSNVLIGKSLSCGKGGKQDGRQSERGRKVFGWGELTPP